jgi:hypothetical protein
MAEPLYSPGIYRTTGKVEVMELVSGSCVHRICGDEGTAESLQIAWYTAWGHDWTAALLSTRIHCPRRFQDDDGEIQRVAATLSGTLHNRNGHCWP